MINEAIRSTSIQSRHWNRLLTEIECGHIVPVVGPELLQIDVEGRHVAVYEHVAEELATRLAEPWQLHHGKKMLYST